MEESKVKEIIVKGLLFLAVIYPIVLILGFTNMFFEDRLPNPICENTTKVWAMWDNKTSTESGITAEMMINISYAYLYNYTLFCPNNDCFIEVNSVKCCIVDKVSESMYCQEDLR